MPKITENRIGEITNNIYGNKMKIIKYNKAIDIVVQFENGYEVKSRYDHFKDGKIKSPYDKSVFGVGFIGEGKYRSIENNNDSKQYIMWISMLRRCYYNNALEKNPSYKMCTVCEEWHNFQNFAQWYDENYYTIENEKICLDKDILFKGNKIYSPNTCMLVPEKINILFTKTDSKRGNYPIGVSLHQYNGEDKYQSRCMDGNRNSIYLGLYNSPKEAFNAYKICKEKIIKLFADSYKNNIPDNLYKALYRYEVEIND